MHSMDKQRYIFGRLFLLSNKLQVIGDQVLAEEMTIMQWFLSACIIQFGDTPPTLGEVSELMGTSHQNVKQLALKLHKRGFLEIEKDIQDLRATRLRLTVESKTFWKRRQMEMKNLLIILFKDLSQEEIDALYSCLNKLYDSISKTEKI